jgi:hypothetical protein
MVENLSKQLAPVSSFADRFFAASPDRFLSRTQADAVHPEFSGHGFMLLEGRVVGRDRIDSQIVGMREQVSQGGEH